jgi:hypothetical protein
MDKNKLIADFMGMKYDEERKFKDGEWIHSARSLSRFEHDWNWLMEAVKEIHHVSERRPFAPEVMIDVMRDAIADASIRGAYDAVVDILMYRYISNQNK